MSDFLNFTLAQAFNLTEKISLFGLLILCIEDLSNAKDYGFKGLYSWKVLSARKNKDFGLIFKNWIIIQVFVIIVCLITISGLLEYKVISFLIITLYLAFFQRRNLYGFDGSEQMLQVIFLLLLFNSLSSSYSFKLVIYYAFVIHIFISYFFSGYNKLKGKAWRKGEALQKILYTDSFGNKKINSILSKYPFLSKSLTYITVIYQIGFPFVMMIPLYELRIIYLCFGIFFHIGIGITMGLNTFIFSFLAIYPILAYFIKND